MDIIDTSLYSMIDIVDTFLNDGYETRDEVVFKNLISLLSWGHPIQKSS